MVNTNGRRRRRRRIINHIIQLLSSINGFFKHLVCLHFIDYGDVFNVYVADVGVVFVIVGDFHRLAHFANSFSTTSNSFALVVRRYSTLGGISG
jgi:hypothetical protein